MTTWILNIKNIEDGGCNLGQKHRTRLSILDYFIKSSTTYPVTNTDLHMLAAYYPTCFMHGAE